jgi:hypothetical protein
MVTKEIKKNVDDCLGRYKKLKQVFLTFCDLCCEMLSKDNFFEMSVKKVNDRQIEIDMLSTTLSLKFLLKKNQENSLPIGCIDFSGYCESDSHKLWRLYFDEKGDVFETTNTKFNSANLLRSQGIEAFLYLILDKYMKHKCFEIDFTYNLSLSDFPES